MLDFHRQRFNVLVHYDHRVGIDMPTANTIVINRADRFGSGPSCTSCAAAARGRSHHRAYAYLVVPERKAMSSDAEKRLERWPPGGTPAPVSPWRRTIWRSAAPASCSARENPARSRRWASMYPSCFERAVRALRRQAARLRPGERARGRRELHRRRSSPTTTSPGRARPPDPVQAHRQRTRCRNARASCRWRWSIASACCPTR